MRCVSVRPVLFHVCCASAPCVAVQLCVACCAECAVCCVLCCVVLCCVVL